MHFRGFRRTLPKFKAGHSEHKEELSEGNRDGRGMKGGSN